MDLDYVSIRTLTEIPDSHYALQNLFLGLVNELSSSPALFLVFELSVRGWETAATVNFAHVIVSSCLDQHFGLAWGQKSLFCWSLRCPDHF